MTRPRWPNSSLPPTTASVPSIHPACLALLLVLSGACASETRCSEFDLDDVKLHAAAGVHSAASAEASYGRRAASSVSEEAAIYSKRHKTLCQLLWDGRIDPKTYERSSAQAYQEYRSSRREQERVAIPPPMYP
jgi:hypothetical protein